VIAHALNERFVELGGNHPVPYVEDGRDGDHHRRREDRGETGTEPRPAGAV
jgi:hypothetical protein